MQQNKIKGLWLRIATPYLYVSALKNPDDGVKDSDSGLRRWEWEERSFLKVGNLFYLNSYIIGLHPVTLAEDSTLLNFVTALVEKKDGYYPAPDNLYYDLLEIDAGDNGVRYAMVSFQTEQEKLRVEEVLMDFPGEDVTVTTEAVNDLFPKKLNIRLHDLVDSDLRNNQESERLNVDREFMEKLIGLLWNENNRFHKDGINPEAFRLGAKAMYEQAVIPLKEEFKGFKAYHDRTVIASMDAVEFLKDKIKQMNKV